MSDMAIQKMTKSTIPSKSDLPYVHRKEKSTDKAEDCWGDRVVAMERVCERERKREVDRLTIPAE